ncbi:MAG TPA: carbonic anhydrase [Terriglobales bacterium]|nr:carbonic anhydrase [Terriglobales bacterium]
MSITDDILRANENYARAFDRSTLNAPPARKLAVLACMDTRLTVEQMLGLNTGDAHIIRNAGGIATDDALRSLIISHHLLGTEEFIVINHTKCGMLQFNDDELRTRLEKTSGKSSAVPARFYGFKDLEQNVREQIERIRSHPWIPSHISVRGFIYDVKTGRLQEVTVEPSHKAS